jgi:hypothetical protein
MRERKRTAIEDLREAIQRLPRHTRLAMLEGLEHSEIIVGAYAHDGGVCPMLAAHRAGGRTTAVAFARAWDQLAFQGSPRRARRARRATERELLILRSHLQASLLEPGAPQRQTSEPTLPVGELARAVAEHARLLAARRERERSEQRPGDRDRSKELRLRPGWAWAPVVRRYDDYERALARLEDERARLGSLDEPALAGR